MMRACVRTCVPTGVGLAVTPSTSTRSAARGTKGIAPAARKAAVAIIAAGFALAVLTTSLRAQTANYQLQWDHTVPPATVAQYQFTLSIDGTARAITPSCGVNPADANGTRCTVPFAALAGNQAHTVVVTAVSAGGQAPSAPLTVTPPNPPTSTTITFTLTIH